MSKEYLYRMSILNRKNSHPLEASSYYSGKDQVDLLTNKNYTSNTKDNVIWSNIATPDKNEDAELYNQLPQYVKFRVEKKDLIDNARNILWRNVFLRETRDDAQFARLFEVSIPSFLTQNEAMKAVSDFSKILIKEGMIADCSVHSRQKSLAHLSLKEMVVSNIKDKLEEQKQEGSLDYTGYLMCTLRDYKEGVFVNKNRGWNDRKKMESWRYKWVEILANTIEFSNTSTEQKKTWEEKMTIYSEYEKIKNEINSRNNDCAKTTALSL
jgi:hypothetical protein